MPRRRRSHRVLSTVRTAVSAVVVGLLLIGTPTMASAVTQSDPTGSATSSTTTSSDPAWKTTPTDPAQGDEASEGPESNPPSTPASDSPTSPEAPKTDAPKTDAPASGSTEKAPTGKAKASDTPSGDAKAKSEAAVGALLVPDPSNSQSVITVKVGDTRTSASSVSNLAGATLGLFENDNDTAPVNNTWALCTSDGDGDCSFTVPNTNGSGTNNNDRYYVKQISTASGYFMNPSLVTGVTGGTFTSRTYQFRTPRMAGGQTYTSADDFMASTGDSSTASQGVWQNSLNNPPASQKCGIDVALINDLSGSVGGSISNLKNAAKTFVDALTGTPSRMSLFTFAENAPANNSNNSNVPNLTNLSTSTSATTLKNHIDGYTSTGATNWDQGFYQVAQNSQHFDLAIVITDGNPTVYQNSGGGGDGSTTRFRETENSIFSANALKAKGTKIVAVGVGDGISSGADNLQAVSGQTKNSDYYQTSNYEAAGQSLRALALGACQGTLTVVKQVVPSSAPAGSITGAQPAGGWTFNAQASAGVTVDPATATTAPVTGALNFGLNFPAGTSTTNVTVGENQQPGYTLQPVSGQNAVCKRVDTGASVSVTNSGNGFVVPAAAAFPVSCTVYNRAPSPQANVTVDKKWKINGVEYNDGDQPGDFMAHPMINGSQDNFGQKYSGFTAGDTVQIGEKADVSDAEFCTLDSQKIIDANGTAVNIDISSSASGQKLNGGDNTYTMENVVTCQTSLTLVKQVANGGANPNQWTLTAVKPAGGITGPQGTTGVTGAVTPGVTYPLAESGGDPSYVQNDTRAPGLSVPGSTGSWVCQELDKNGAVISGYADGINGGVKVPLGSHVRCTAVNQTAELTLSKTVVNDNGGSAAPSAWTLKATPVAPNPSGAPTVSLAGSAAGATANVRPGLKYTLTETGGPSGYDLKSLQCAVNGGDFADATDFTVAAGDAISCKFTNDDVRAHLTLKKVVAANGLTDVAAPGAWTLAAAGPTAISGAGNSAAVTAQPVDAGTYTLAESNGPGGYSASAWTCDNGPVTGGKVAVAAGADVTCTITNTAQKPKLTLVKKVENGASGATAAPADWTLTAAGPETVSGPGAGAGAVTATVVDTGTYNLSEQGPSGYSASSWVCVGGDQTGAAVKIAAGQDVTCTITNTATPPKLTLVKHVDNGTTGATTAATAWTLKATGAATVSGKTGDASITTATVPVGSYALTETGPSGYDASAWDCGPATVTGGSVALKAGDNVTCEITNTAQQPKLKLVKKVENTHGGTLTPADWKLSASGPTPVQNVNTGTTTDVKVGDYALSEAGTDPFGYQLTGLDCTKDGASLDNRNVSIALGDDVTCTFTNSDKPAHLSLEKIVDAKDTASSKVPADWTLTATPIDLDGQAPVSGNGDPASSGGVDGVELLAGTYTLKESGPKGFDAGDWVCEGGTVDGNVLTVPVGGTVECSITNTAVSPQLTLVKKVDNGDTDGTATPADWTLGAQGPTPISGKTGEAVITKAPVKVGEYTLGETKTVTGYDAGDWSCDGGTLAGDEVTLAEGEDVTCEITNTAVASAWTYSKSSDPASGSTVLPGSEITYTVTATHTGGVAPKNLKLTDDLSKVLNHASLVGEPDPSTGDASVSGDTLTWNIDSLENTASVTYTVKVDADARSVTLKNVVTSDSPGGECTGDNDCSTTHEVPGWTLEKTSDPASGSTVELGATVTYTLTVHNTSKVPVTGAIVHDDVSKVVDHATLGTLPNGLTLAGETLTWAVPTIPVDGEQSIQYTATVGTATGDAGKTLKNVATPTGTGECEEADDCTTEDYTPSWTLAKTSDPETGSVVHPGDEVKYTLHVTNTSEHAEVKGAVVEDDLSKVLDNATMVGDLDDQLELNGTTLTWKVPTIDAGDSTPVTVSYTVKINAGADGIDLVNVATPKTPGGECVEDADCTTEQGTPRWTLEKTSDPAPGSTVLPGDVIDYTLTVVNTSDVSLTAHVKDDLTDVLKYADVVDDGGATVTGNTLTWLTAPLTKKGDTAELHYSVKVKGSPSDHDAPWGVTIGNVATPDDPAGHCVADGKCETTQVTPSWSLSKTSDPASGSTVNPGDTITYTLTATNTSDAIVSGAKAEDDLSDVLDNAALGTLPDGLVRDGDKLVWTIPTLNTGDHKTASISYSVTLNDDAYSADVKNVVTPDTGTGGECTTDSDCTTDHTTGKVDLALAKSHTVPAEGVAVDNGKNNEIAYILNVKNVGELTATKVVVDDALPAGLTFVKGSEDLPQGWTLKAGDDGRLTFSHEDAFKPGDSADLKFTVTVGKLAQPDISKPIADIDNGACVTAAQPDGNTKNNCDDDKTPVKSIAITGEAACVADVPYFTYDVTPSNVTGDTKIALIWWSKDAFGKRDVNIDATDKAALLKDGAIQVDYIDPPNGWTSGQEIEGKKLWPGASVDSNGKPSGWPGFSQKSDGAWVLDPAAFGYDIREQAVVEIRINPSVDSVTVYPPATPKCDDVPPTAPPTTAPPATPPVAAPPAGGGLLERTGGAATAIGLLGLILVGLGTGFTLWTRRRRAEH